MSELLRVTYHGGPRDGQVERVFRDDLAALVGRFPYCELVVGDESHVYQAFVLYSGDEETLDVFYAGVELADEANGDLDDGYDGWLSPTERYDEGNCQ